MEIQQSLSLSHSIRACQQLTALASSNFTPAFALLPVHKRQAMEILYAYTRFTDDIADLPDFNPTTGSTIEVSTRRKKQKFNQWVGVLEAVLGRIGDENVPQIDPNDEKTFQQIAKKFPGCGGVIFLPALKMIVDKYNIPREPLFHLIDGVESDMDSKPFVAFEDCATYCHQVATSVGFASLAILGTTKPLFSEEVVRAAKACGVAFQWTNIVRDMLEDYQNGRIYLPQSELQRFGLTGKQFGSLLDGTAWSAQKRPPKTKESFDRLAYKQMIEEMGKFEEKFMKLVAHQLHRCEVYYENSIPLYYLIDRDSRRTFGLMWNYYYALFQTISRNPWKITKGIRVRPSSCRKFRLWFHWRFMPCFRLH